MWHPHDQRFQRRAIGKDVDPAFIWLLIPSSLWKHKQTAHIRLSFEICKHTQKTKKSRAAHKSINKKTMFELGWVLSVRNAISVNSEIESLDSLAATILTRMQIMR